MPSSGELYRAFEIRLFSYRKFLRVSQEGWGGEGGWGGKGWSSRVLEEDPSSASELVSATQSGMWISKQGGSRCRQLDG